MLVPYIRRWMSLAVPTLVLGLATSAPSLTIAQEAGVSSSEILIGAIGALTGPLSFIGTPGRDGMTVGFNEINARGGRMLALGSAVILVVGIVGFFVPEKYTLFYIGGGLIVVLAAIIIPLVSFIGWQRRFGP